MKHTSFALPTADFKSLVSAVTRFPSVGGFGDSEMISFVVAAKGLVATASGLVLSQMRVAFASNYTGSFAVSGKDLASFASVCPDGSGTVKLEVAETEVVLKCGPRELRSPLATAKKFPAPVWDGLSVDVTKEVADGANYLADLAFGDTSRAELCCVMFTDRGEAMASDQRTLAVLRVPEFKTPVAVPVTLAKALAVGDRLHVGTKDTVLKRVDATYSMPTLVKAQKGFPLGRIREIAKKPRKAIATVDGAKLAAAVGECATALAARTEIVSTVTVSGAKVVLEAKNGGAKYTQTFSAIASKGASATDTSFKVPLDSVLRTVPFLTGHVQLSQGQDGELILSLEGGWVQFSAWKEQKKK